MVQVTVVPAGTVKVSGAKAKLSMLTAFGPAGAGAAWPGSGGDMVIDPIEPIVGPEPLPGPLMPGVPLTSELKTAVGEALCCGAVELHAARSRTAPESATRDRRDTTGTSVVVGNGCACAPLPTDTVAGYTPQAG